MAGKNERHPTDKRPINRSITNITVLMGTAVINPGDRVLLSVAEGTEPQQMEMLKEFLERKFPDVEFIVIAGADVFSIQKPKEPVSDTAGE